MIMIEYKIIKELEKEPLHTQRTLADKFNISLGKTNFIIKNFIKIGAIQVKKVKDHHDKIRWHYYLTPKGLLEKMKLAQFYFEYLSIEYDSIEKELLELTDDIKK